MLLCIAQKRSANLETRYFYAIRLCEIQHSCKQGYRYDFVIFTFVTKEVFLCILPILQMFTFASFHLHFDVITFLGQLLPRNMSNSLLNVDPFNTTWLQLFWIFVRRWKVNIFNYCSLLQPDPLLHKIRCFNSNKTLLLRFSILLCWQGACTT